MSSNEQSLIYEYISNLIIYFYQKSNEYFLIFTIIISMITLILTLTIVFESKFYLIKKYFFQSRTSESFLNWLFNSSNHIKKRFFDEFIHSLNEEFSSKKERFTIETVQFAHAKISNVSQTSVETIVINAILDIDHLILNVIEDQHFSIKIPKLTGEFKILLINDIIEVKFNSVEINNAEIIDLKNILSSDERQTIIKLLKEVINQTNVQYCFYLSDNQEKIQPPIPPIVTQFSNTSQQCETPISTPIIDNNSQQTFLEKQVKKLLVRIVKAVRLHDVEQPFCILELNQPKQIHQTSLAKNGVNPFWDERFLFECNDKSNEIHLKIIDRKKSTKKLRTNNIVDIIYADISIPFSYVTSTIYKQDVRITPQYPDSIIRIEFSTLTEEEALIANNGYGTDSPTWSNDGPEINNHRQSSADEILTLTSNTDIENNNRYYPSITNDTFSTLSPLTSPDDDIRFVKPRKSRSFMNSFRIFSRKKKDKQNENAFTSTQPNLISHSLSTEPFLSLNTTNPTLFDRQQTKSRSFRNFFRSKKTLNHTNNFIIDHPDLLATSTPTTTKKRSFFRRFKSKQKQQIHFSTNSLTSDDCTRTESARNTPIRANVGRPVTMTNS